LASVDAADYTYLTLPPGKASGSCIGSVVAGLTARAKIGVAGLEEAIRLLEDQHAAGAWTRYRFYLKDEGLVVEVEEGPSAGRSEADETSGWRTIVEMVS
jgi:hypothetical protein